MLKRLLADRGQAEGGQAPLTAASPGMGSSADEPDPGMRRLGWLLIAVVVVIVIAVAAMLSRLPGLWGSDRPAMQAAPGATWVGEFPATEGIPSAPAEGTSAGVVAPPASGPRDPGAGSAPSAGPTAGATGGAAVAGEAATTAPGATAPPGGTAESGTTAPATGEPGAAAEPTSTLVLPPDVQSALAGLSAEISSQVDAGQLAPVAGSDLQGKVHQVAREVSEGDWAAARYYADRIREKLRKYRDDGMVTSTGYQALIAKLDVLDAALS